MNPIVAAGHKVLSNRYAYSTYQYCVGGTQFRKRTILKQIDSVKPRGVLDLGCGPGPTLNCINRQIGFSGVDFSEEYLRLAEKKRTSSNLILADVTDNQIFEKVPSEHLDLILAMGLFHHLSDDQLRLLVRNLLNHMRDDSMIISIDPTISRTTTRIARWFALNDRGMHVRSPEEIQSYFPESEFQVKATFSANEFNIPLDTIKMEITVK